MDGNEWPDPRSAPLADCEDVLKEVKLLSAQVLELQLEIESHRWWRWGVLVGIVALLWRVG